MLFLLQDGNLRFEFIERENLVQLKREVSSCINLIWKENQSPLSFCFSGEDSIEADIEKIQIGSATKFLYWVWWSLNMLGSLRNRRIGSTETWTRIVGFRVQSANHYTTEPAREAIVYIFFSFQNKIKTVLFIFTWLIKKLKR